MLVVPPEAVLINIVYVCELVELGLCVPKIAAGDELELPEFPETPKVMVLPDGLAK